MDSWYVDDLVLFNESKDYTSRNPQGYIMRRDGYEAQLPEMPWKIDENDMFKRHKEEDPGTCARCGKPFVMVRPGKSQPNCVCWDAPEDNSIGCLFTRLPKRLEDKSWD